MPYVSDSNLEENEKQTPGATAPANQPGQTSGQPNAVSGSPNTQQPASQGSNASTEAPQAPTLASGTGLTTSMPGQGSKGATGGGTATSGSGFDPNAPTSSGNWTNIQNYLAANNGGAFGQQFAGNVGGDVTQAQSAITNAGNGFQSKVDQGTLKNNQDVLNEVGTAPESMSDADQSAFESQLNGSYSGPQSAANDTGFSAADAQAHGAYTEAQQAQNPGGQQALLPKFYNTPNYTTGQKSLDAAILSMDPGAQAALQQLASQAGTLPVNYQKALTDANGAIAKGQAASSQAKNAANSTLWGEGGSFSDNPNAGAIGNLYQSLQSQGTAAKAAYDQQQKDIQDAIAKGDFSKLAALGYSDPEQYTYGVSPGNYATFNPDTSINMNTTATAQQAARMDALAKLAGLQNDPYLNSQLAGTAPTSPVTFNQGDVNTAGSYAGDVEIAKQAYTNHAAPFMQQLAQASSGNLGGNVQPTRVAQESYINSILTQLNPLRAQYGLPALTLHDITSAPGFVSDPYNFSNAPGPVLGPIITGGGSTSGGSTPLL